jgi:hypothetical protein
MEWRSFAMFTLSGVAASADQSPLPACEWQKYDNRIHFHCGALPARASRLTADDRSQAAILLRGSLTLMFPQNISGTDGLGYHRVNFRLRCFFREHLLIRPAVHTRNRGVARR